MAAPPTNLPSIAGVVAEFSSDHGLGLGADPDCDAEHCVLGESCEWEFAQ